MRKLQCLEVVWEAILYLLSYNLYDCTLSFLRNTFQTFQIVKQFYIIMGEKWNNFLGPFPVLLFMSKKHLINFFMILVSCNSTVMFYINTIIVKCCIVFFSCTFRHWACHLSKCEWAFNFCVRHWSLRSSWRWWLSRARFYWNVECFRRGAIW